MAIEEAIRKANVFIKEGLTKMAVHYQTIYGMPLDIFNDIIKKETKGWNYGQLLGMVYSFKEKNPKLW